MGVKHAPTAALLPILPIDIRKKNPAAAGAMLILQSLNDVQFCALSFCGRQAYDVLSSSVQLAYELWSCGQLSSARWFSEPSSCERWFSVRLSCELWFYAQQAYEPLSSA